MKYSIYGFQQDKLIANNLTTDDALILRMIKDLYSTSKMEFIEHLGIRYIWVNYSYLYDQIPIIGSKRNLMRRIERYGNELFIIRILKHEKGILKGNFSYIAPTEKLDDLQDFDLMTESHKVTTEPHNPYDKNGITLMTESHNKDNTIRDNTIRDNSFIKNNKENPTDRDQDKWKSEFEIFRKAFTGIKNGLETEYSQFVKKNKNYKDIIPLLLPAIEKENDYRAKANEINAFFPASKSLSTWLNKKCWEQELPVLIPRNIKKTNETQKPQLEYQKKGQSYNGYL